MLVSWPVGWVWVVAIVALVGVGGSIEVVGSPVPAWVVDAYGTGWPSQLTEQNLNRSGMSGAFDGGGGSGVVCGSPGARRQSCFSHRLFIANDRESTGIAR
jgi:hypothetical protein